MRHGATSLIAVPAALHDLVRAAEAASCSLSTVRMLLIGGGAPSPALELSARKAFPAARMTLAYGMTEAASSISFQDLPLPSASAAPSSPTSASAPAQGSMSARAPGSTSTIEPQHTCVGLPAQKSVIVVQPDSRLQNQSTSNMQLGEVVIRGPSMMLGYWNNPAANVVAFLPGGGFRTGDIGFLDAQGRLWLAGRLKNLIRSGSESVQAAHVQTVLESCPQILSAAVMGLPDERLGQSVAALVVVSAMEHSHSQPRIMRAQQLAALQRHCTAQGLSRFQLPRFVVQQQQALPTTALGKISGPRVLQLLQQLHQQPPAARL